MYTYSQSTGVLAQDGTLVLIGYSGIGPGHNPAMQNQRDVGPIPQGRYTMTALVADAPITGLATIDLDPDPANQMFGRTEFRIHGDNPAANHTASDGCIIAGHEVDRIAIWNSGDHDLEVLP